MALADEFQAVGGMLREMCRRLEPKKSHADMAAEQDIEAALILIGLAVLRLREEPVLALARATFIAGEGT